MFNLLKDKKYDEFEKLVEANELIVNYLTYDNHFEPTLLIHAVEYNKDNDVVKYLSKHRVCDIRTPDHISQTAFHLCAFNDNLEAMKYLLERDRSVLNHCTFMRSPLHYAVYQSKEMVEFLLQQEDIDVNIKEYYGRTPDCLPDVDKEIVELIKSFRKKQKKK